MLIGVGDVRVAPAECVASCQRQPFNLEEDRESCLRGCAEAEAYWEERDTPDWKPIAVLAAAGVALWLVLSGGKG